MIDDCERTFEELVSTVLPSYMLSLSAAMEKPVGLTEFCMPHVGSRTILKRLGLSRDFSGCYVLMHEGKAFYVGISRSVIGRLRQHGTGKTHFDASLAYRMASENVVHKMTRNAAMKDGPFRQAFDEAKLLLRNSRVAFVEISNPLELYLFEAYCAIKLDTSKWNSFRTH
jgi:predicted GIY-YIG superfamily endonuclease